jgi:ABC-type hemin transport system ATPase subunit
MNIDESKARAARLLTEELPTYVSEDWSEADTRSKLIDAVLIEVLGWNEPTIKREPHVAKPKGYIDYLLHTSRVAYVVEAKKSSVRFSLPSTKRQRAFKVGGVLSEDKQLREAIDQCRNYGIAKGTSFCCVTNGTQYVFFRAHSELGIEFEDHQAIVFDGPDDLLSHFGLFYSLLSFDSVCEGNHYNALPVVEAVDVSARFKQLSSQSHRGRYKNRNRIEPFIRTVVTEVFQDLAAEGADIELIEQCYVESPSQGSYEHSFRDLVRGRPTLADGAVRPLRVTRRNAGEFEDAFDASRISGSKTSEVLMLLGGIGAGKTTFISRFRKVIGRERIDKECLWLYANFNKYSDAPGQLEKWVANEIVSEAERNYEELGFGSFSHLKQAYHPEYERLKRGRLAPLFAGNPDGFELEFAKELAGFEKESIAHVIKLLKSAQIQHKRRVFLVFDNADQFDAKLQNDVYMLAHRIASEVGCSLIVSMREESFWKNKDFGVLSAFHGVNLYVEAPDLKQVVSKRFRYAASLLENADPRLGADLGITREEALGTFASIRDTVLGDKRFIQFLEDLSPGEVRRPLDQLARFLFSGHTNVDSLIGAIRGGRKLEIGFHEFIKSVALGDRETFDEEKSDVVNLFSLDGSVDASNVNRLALLGVVHSYRKDKGEHGLGYVSFEKILDVCVGSGLSADTVQAAAQFLNARRLLETHQQARDVVVPSLFVRTTKAFDYYLNFLGNQFAYIDLILPGTVVPQGAYFDMLERLSTQIYAGGGIGVTRLERVSLRIERARKFASFMREEAERHALFKAADVIAPEVRRYVVNLDASLEKQSTGIVAAAKAAFAAVRERERSGGAHRH